MSHIDKTVTCAPKISENTEGVRKFFTDCVDQKNIVRCNICSLKLRGDATSTLWDHIITKHKMDKSIRTMLMSNPDSLTNDLSWLKKSSFDKPKTTAESKSQTNGLDQGNMTSRENRLVQRNHSNQNHLKNLRLMNYQDDTSTLSSTKSVPSSSSSSSSSSKNLITRFNEMSAPIKRKLKFWNKRSFQVNQYDPSFKVIYLGNLGMQLCSKDESCLEKPLNTLWNNYLVNMKTEIVMRLTICNSGLKAITRQHGLTQYWSNRLVYCCCHNNYPRVFAWVYRHEGKKMRQELRCHAVFCPSPEKASKMVAMLSQRLARALEEFRREKKFPSHSSTNSHSMLHKVPRTIPLRRQILAKGSTNFRPPLERSKSAPKLTSIMEEEDYDSDELMFSQEEVLTYEESFGDRDEDVDDDHDEFVDGGYLTRPSIDIGHTNLGKNDHDVRIYRNPLVLTDGSAINEINRSQESDSEAIARNGCSDIINYNETVQMKPDHISISTPSTESEVRCQENKNNKKKLAKDKPGCSSIDETAAEVINDEPKGASQTSANIHKSDSSFDKISCESIIHDSKIRDVESSNSEAHKIDQSNDEPDRDLHKPMTQSAGQVKTDEMQEIILSWSNDLVIR